MNSRSHADATAVVACMAGAAAAILLAMILNSCTHHTPAFSREARELINAMEREPEP